MVEKQVSGEDLGYHDMRAVMEAAFPAVFTPRGTAPVPLDIGVGVELRVFGEKAFTKTDFKRFMGIWTNRPEYHMAMIEASYRRKLNGVVGQPVSEGARQHAISSLGRRLGKIVARRTMHISDIDALIDEHVGETRQDLRNEIHRVADGIVRDKGRRAYFSRCTRRAVLGVS